MTGPIRVLIVEDNDDDAQLVLRALKSTFAAVDYEVVESKEAFAQKLAQKKWDGLICDHHLPSFDAFTALQILKETELDLPTIVVSGSIGEDTAVATMRAGAHDYVMKSSLSRLGPALERELREAEARKKVREAERALRQADVRFKTVVRSTNDFIFTLDKECRYTGVWGRWLELEGHSPEAYLGERISHVHGEGSRLSHETACALALKGESLVYDWSEPGERGLRHYQTSLAPLQEDSEGIVGLVGFRREVTELKNAQAMLYVSDRMVSMGTLAAGVAHEINNPLAAVIADLEFVNRVLKGGVSEDPAEVAAAVRNAKEAAQSIRQIVSDLKIFTRPEEEQRAPFELQQALESSLRMVWNEIRHRARVVKDYGPIPLVEANQARVGQVFLNLLVNAAQALDDRGPQANEIRVRTTTDSRGWAVVEIRDTGKGIPKENLTRIFDPFFTTKPVGVGTGLGLFVCHRIITELGGELTVDSEVGKGSAFRVKFPPAQDAQREERRPVDASAAARRGKVMVVDDEKMIGSAVRRTLEAEHEVAVFTSAKDALAVLVSGQRFDVILCDLMMPQMTGMDLHAEAVRCCPEQAERIVFLTGGAFTPQSQEFLERVPNAHLDKPFDTEQLRALVNGRVR
jgi:PAS domain S-box-containing protein